MTPSDDGGVVVFVALLLAATTSVASVVSLGARGVIDAERASIAADAAALAGVWGGEELALRAAAANGGTVSSTSDETDESGVFRATVRVGGREATSTAADRWFPLLRTLRE